MLTEVRIRILVVVRRETIDERNVDDVYARVVADDTEFLLVGPLTPVDGDFATSRHARCEETSGDSRNGCDGGTHDYRIKQIPIVSIVMTGQPKGQ